MAMTFFKFPQGSAALTLVYGEKEDGRKGFFAADGRGGTPLRKIKPTHAAWALQRSESYLRATADFASCFAGSGAAAGAGAEGNAMPSFLRTSISILAIMSLFSLRNCLVFSRPWPMRSPL